MNLIIDVGNSLVKLAVFQNAQLITKHSVPPNLLLDRLKELQNDYSNLQHAIVASVGMLDDKELKIIQRNIDLLILDYNTPVPFKNLYESPKTLGVDRIALVAAAVMHYPNKNTLIIDAGTCVTYDFISADHIYLGGAISPGIKMRYQALNHFTAKLPMLNIDMPENIIGNSTNASIHSGVINGVVKELDGIINEYHSKYSDLTVILTGGDSKFLSKQLKSSIFANSNFLLEGLNYILQFNTN